MIPLKSKIIKKEYLGETITDILTFNIMEKLYLQIANYIKIPKSTITKFIQQASKISANCIVKLNKLSNLLS